MAPRSCAKSKMNRPRFQTAGWAAFDREHREKKGIRADAAVNSCPSISNEPFSGKMESSDGVDSGKSLLPVQSVRARSFSSVVRPSTIVDFPLLKAYAKIGDSSINIYDNQHAITGKSNANPVVMLKDVHSWADQDLIEDILAAVNNDMRQASFLLKEMISYKTQTKNMQPAPALSSTAAVTKWIEDKDSFLEKNSCIMDNIISENSLKELIIKQFYVPTEPEWEEDDFYLSRRKEALKIMREASQHSQAASNAYMRGDHLSAQQHSAMAREKWMSAKKLNVQAAEEILRVRNRDNDIWKLDLHGLHATEAVHALKQHLESLESKMMTSHRVSPDEQTEEEQIQGSSSFGSLGGEISKGNVVPQKRQSLLHVITGTGNHSKGQAALPAAVKGFLMDEGYRFDDARPGVISVRPKFRYK